MTDYGPRTLAADSLHAMKYRGQGEDFREAMNRVAFGLKDSDKHYHELRQILLHQRFCPGGRIQAAIGSSKAVTSYNCLGGETLVLTREHGLVAIESLEGQRATVLDGNGKWTLSEFQSFGEQELYDITFTNSRKNLHIRSTIEHAWIIEGKREALGSLKKNDRIDSRNNPNLFEGLEDYKRGIIHGFVYGDGTKTQDRWGFFVRVSKAKIAAMLPFLDRFPNSYPPSYDGDPVFYFYGDNAWTDFKSLPDIGGSEEYLLGFMRGWFCADGCVSTQPEVILSMGATERDWVTTFGPIVNFHVVGYSYLDSQTNFGMRNKTICNVRLDRRFLSNRDFLQLAHSSRFEKDNSEKWRFARRSSQPVAVEKVYCAIVPTTNSFTLSKGLLSGNCFVSGTIADSFVDGQGSIMSRAHEAAATMRMGGGIGYNFSTLRPRGDLIAKLQSQSSGPISFMHIFDAVCLATSSSGHRRGAQMGILRVDHPDVEEFVRAKQNDTALRGFNISLAITDEFMEAVAREEEFNLRFQGRTYRTVNAAELWEKVMRSTWDFAEPGVVFIDTIDRMNNLWYCETLAATNPCSEQPLPPFGACLLGSFNLVKYLRPKPSGSDNPIYYIDFDQLEEDIPIVVRGMDNVVERSRYPLAEQRAEAMSKRRMGLGVMGLANALEACGHAYGTEGFLTMESDILERIKDGCYAASVDLAKEKGPFPLFDAERYLKGQFVKTLPEHIRAKIALYGIRNSHLTSIAPTGTISLCADNVSGGLEPVFSYVLERTIHTPDGPINSKVEDYGAAFLQTRGKLAKDVTAAEHIAVLATAQKHIDSAVSKTVNMTSAMPWQDFKDTYRQAWELGCKGCATFNSDGKRGALLIAKDENNSEEISCLIVDPLTGQRDCG